MKKSLFLFVSLMAVMASAGAHLMRTKFSAFSLKAPFRAVFPFLLAFALLSVAQTAPADDGNTYLFTVSNGADDGAGSLRAAITAANALNTNPDVKIDRPVVITFDPSVFDGTGPAITLTSGSIVLENHIRIFNSSASATDVVINGSNNGGNSIFHVNAGIGSDGELFKVSIESVAFTSGKAPQGGAIQNYAELVLKGVQFAQNEATITTGAGGGGAIYNFGLNAHLKISDCVFWANKFTGPDISTLGGGAIYNEGGAELVILDGPGGGTSFDGNVTTNNGGAIYNAAGSTITISDTEFTTNKATLTSGASGGAIHNTSTEANTVKDSRFTGNEAAGNSALGYGGGAIYNKEGILAVSHTSFSNNTGGKGGAIFSYGSSTDNTAQNTILTIGDGSEFLNNEAIDEGGAILNLGATLTVSDSKFDGNKATNASNLGGGAISIDNAASSNDSYTTLTHVDFISNTSLKGGAIRLKGQNSELTINGGKFENNQATNGDGGAIYNQNSNKKILVSGTTFKANTASGNGGAIESTASASGEMEIINSLFEGNKAAYQSGGAINNTSVLTLTNTNFTNNVAGVETGGPVQGQGGAIAHNGTKSVTIDGGSFAGNKATSDNSNSGAGGAIYNKASLTIQNTVFTGNQTTGTSTSMYGGGAIFTEGSTTDRIFIVNSIFKGNTSTSYGGAVHARDYATIAHSTLTGNTATGSGKDAYVRNGGYFLNNRAEDIVGNSGTTIKAAYSTFTAGSASDLGTATNNISNAGTLVARNVAGDVFFADLTANLWTQADVPGTTFPFDITAPALSGATIYNMYIDGTTPRLDGGAISVNGALADASGNAAPVPGGSGIIAATPSSFGGQPAIDYTWEPAYDDNTAATALTYNIYLSATSPVDVTGTPDAVLTMMPAGSITYTNTNLSLPYIAVVVVDNDATTPLSAAYKEPADVIAPIVIAVTPAPSATDVAIDGTVDITFSEEIDASSLGNVYLNELLLTETPTLVSNQYQIAYSGLAYATFYTIRIEGFKDMAGNTMVTDNSNGFTTLTASAATGDVTPPEVWRTHDSSADSIYVSGANKGNIAITFTEPMSSLYGTVVLTSSADGTTTILPDAGTWSADSTVYTILYGGLTTGTEYTITVRDFRDLSGNSMVAHDAVDNKFTASGDDIAAPSVGVTGIVTPEAGSDKLVFTFSESMDGSAIPASITLAPAIGLQTPGFWSNDNTVYTVITTADFNTGAAYTATFDGFKDASGNALPAATGIDVILGTTPAPAVSSITPANGATGVAIAGDVVITFSETMDAAIAGSVALNDGTSDLILDASVATWSGNAYTIAYGGLANSTAYTVKVSGFTNTSGVAMADNSSNSFTTIAAAPVTYTLTLDAQGGSVSPSTLTVTAGAAAGTLPVPVRTDYTFDGWFTGTGASGTQYTASTIATGNVTLYAAWTAVPVTPNPDPDPDPVVPDPDPTDPTDPTNPTGVEDAPQTASVWSSNQQLHIYAPQAQKVRIHTITGLLNKQLSLSANETLTVFLQRGIYIVTFESGLRRKVLVK